MNVQQLEQKLGISRANIRFYEREGLFQPKRNPLNDYRDYSTKDIHELQKILFLRSLSIPVEKIRLYQQGTSTLHEILRQQIEQIEEKQNKNKESIELCQSLIQNENYEYAQLPLSLELSRDKNTLYDQQVNLPFLFEVVATCGFFLYQVFYTCSIYLLLPNRIPINWSGLTVIRTEPRLYIFVYILITALLLIALRSNLFFYYSKTFLYHRDYIRALLSNLLIGFYLAMQHYIVFFTQGFSMSQDYFLFLWILVQSSLWVVGTLIVTQLIKQIRRKEGKKQ